VDRAGHWDDVYGTRRVDEVSWFQHRPVTSLALLEGLALPSEAGIVDVGGGASTLVDELVAAGHRDVTVVDVSETALDAARGRLAVTVGGGGTSGVAWVRADVTSWVPGRTFAAWHDRAVFHFLVDPGDRAHYRAVLAGALDPGAHAVVATFAVDGPTTCSGLPVQRYDADDLVAELGEGFDLVEARRELHTTPGGATQPFTWVVLRRA